MTSERRLLAGLADIRAVTFECAKCETRVSLAPMKINDENIVTACPKCQQHWFNTNRVGTSVYSSPLLNFLVELRDATKAEQDVNPAPRVRVFFEFDEPDR